MDAESRDEPEIKLPDEYAPLRVAPVGGNLYSMAFLSYTYRNSQSQYDPGQAWHWSRN